MNILTWEQIDPYTQRAAIIGGWLVKSYEDVYEKITPDHPYESGYQYRIAMTFVPDVGHHWKSDWSGT
jgi:hypothetical protein